MALVAFQGMPAIIHAKTCVPVDGLESVRGNSGADGHGSAPSPGGAVRDVGARWHVAQTKPAAEGRAFLNLQRQGYQAFLPQVRKTVRHARKVEAKLAPLFPGYLFIRLDLGREPWSAINSTYGVARLIMQDGRPQAVPAGLVESLRDRVGEEGTLSWKPLLTIGQSVRIAEGPFADFAGVLEHLDGAGRVRVLLNLLGRSVSVALRSEALIPVA